MLGERQELASSEQLFSPQKPLLISCAVATGRRSIVVCGDVTKEDDVTAMVATTVDQLGELNVSPMSVEVVEFSAG